ncbi:MAG: RES family NAD+ phosphorylase [Alphaproteobacteria bacterium]
MASRSEGPLLGHRIGDSRFPLFSAAGSLGRPGRWHSGRLPVIYAAASFAGAMLERLAQVGTDALPLFTASIIIRIPRGVAIEIALETDVPGWDAPDKRASRAFGERWLRERRTAVLTVPSVVARLERNLLINPAHPDFEAITATEPVPVIWDARLFR